MSQTEPSQPGNTAKAGRHIPVMVHEVLAQLNLQPGATVVDATLGRGGHSRLMAQGPWKGRYPAGVGP
jgi:16S rRNA (cytosine1402-N4)-methyltransferase